MIVFIESVNFTYVLNCEIRQTLHSKPVFLYNAKVLPFFRYYALFYHSKINIKAIFQQPPWITES